MDLLIMMQEGQGFWIGKPPVDMASAFKNYCLVMVSSNHTSKLRRGD